MNNPAAQNEDGDINLVEIWLRKDPVRWIAGAMAGLFSGAVALVFAGVLAAAFGAEFWFPFKVAAIPALGASAAEYGMKTSVILAGFAISELIAMVLGIVYAHFTGTNSLLALLGAGFVWGAFSWVFIQNLFIQSFTDVFAAQLPAGAAFPVLMVFGLSLCSVAFFDRAIRRKD